MIKQGAICLILTVAVAGSVRAQPPQDPPPHYAPREDVDASVYGHDPTTGAPENPAFDVSDYATADGDWRWQTAEEGGKAYSGATGHTTLPTPALVNGEYPFESGDATATTWVRYEGFWDWLGNAGTTPSQQYLSVDYSWAGHAAATSTGNGGWALAFGTANCSIRFTADVNSNRFGNTGWGFSGTGTIDLPAAYVVSDDTANYNDAGAGERGYSNTTDPNTPISAYFIWAVGRGEALASVLASQSGGDHVPVCEAGATGNWNKMKVDDLILEDAPPVGGD